MSNSQMAERPLAVAEVVPFRGSTKLQDHHRCRSAIVYVRQSSAHQVVENTESTARQYALVHRAVQLGWSGDRVEVIDEDQGQSGTSAEGRLGFQRLLAEVGLNHVGIILGTEMSRLARSNKDWHQLIELCAIFRTLLADQDGLYDPTDYNDRLLLGLRGMMSEAEIHLLQGRMHEALLNKWSCGYVYMNPAGGYLKIPSAGFGLDPDEQARSVIRLIFDQFERQGSVRQVLRYLQLHDIKLPIRPQSGPNKGALEWRRATRDTVRTVLMHPLYAGTYRYGHRQTDQRRKKPGHRESGRIVVERGSYHALIFDHCPAYISHEQYERNQRRVKENRLHPSTKGPPREGPALLGGLLFCGRCQKRMTVHYSGVGLTLRYVCQTGTYNADVPRCPGFSGRVLDALVTEKIMLALQPAALELSLQAANDLEDDRRKLDTDWRQRLERCRYDAERVQRQYCLVEPENRLVARELERQWEQALQQVANLEREYARFRQTHPTSLSDEQREQIRSLSQSLPALWQASTTSWADRQRIVRLLVERVVVHIQESSNLVDVSLQWSGGFTSQHDLIRPVPGYQQMVDYERLVSRIEELRGQRRTFAEIADTLNNEGFHPAQQAEQFDKDIVNRLFRKLCPQRPVTKQLADQSLLGANEWFVLGLAERLKIPKNTLQQWIHRGWVHVVRQLPGYRGRMVCWADSDEVTRLSRLRETDHSWWNPPLPSPLITPKRPTAKG